jgi:hypothetical protein
VHYGRYENECGFVVLTKVPSSTKEPIPTKLGFTQSRVYFPPCHIFPETTTARPGFVPLPAGQPIISVPGERVVIIGADLEGNSDLVGNYALIIQCPWPLHPTHALIQVCSQGPAWGQSRYFDERSLCRSYIEQVEWMGKMIH